jgi:hypothetical protein
MSKHTPGPWAHENYQGVIHVFVDNQGGTPSVCKLIGPDKEANARLIAAAPDLLEALSDVVKFWDSIVPTDCVNDMHIKARAAIAKATGGAE